MYLFDKPLTQKEFKNELDMLEGNINRICVADDVAEVSTMLGFAVDRLNIIAHSKILELTREEKNDSLRECLIEKRKQEIEDEAHTNSCMNTLCRKIDEEYDCERLIYRIDRIQEPSQVIINIKFASLPNIYIRAELDFLVTKIDYSFDIAYRMIANEIDDNILKHHHKSIVKITI